MFFGIPALKNFAKFSAKYLWQCLLLINLQMHRHRILWKLDQCYFPMNFRNISEQLLFRKPQGGCSCRSISWSRFWFICRIARTKFTSENMSWITIQFHFFESLNNWYLIIFHCFSFGWVAAAFKHECNTEIALPLSLEFFWHYAIATAPTF